jgi:hypothetical protein
VGVGGSPESKEVAIVDEVLPAGHFQVWVLGCLVPNAPASADVSIVVQAGYRWPDVIPADVPTDDPLENLGAAAALWPALRDIEAVPATRATIRRGELPGRPACWRRPGRARRLVILHGAYRRFYPYFDVVGDGIDDRLVEHWRRPRRWQVHA